MRAIDLQVGRHYVMRARAAKEPDDPFGFFHHGPRQDPRDGVAVQIVAKNLPFVIVTGCYGQEVIDTRLIEFIPAGPKYLREFAKMYEANKEEVVLQHRAKLRKKKRKKVKPDPRNCPRCHVRMVLRKTATTNWMLVCPECGAQYEGAIA